MKGANGQLPRPRPDIRLYLFHGADDAGAAELARRLIAAMPEAERIDLDGATLKREPGRLADEAASLSLFGDVRLIRAAPIGEESVEAVMLLLAADRAGSPVVAVAPGVKTAGKLITLANGDPRALTIACYPPSAADLDKAVQTLMAESGLRPAPGLGRRLIEAGARDRAVIAREIEKLVLYLDAAPDRPRDASMQDFDAIGADNGEAALSGAADALVDAKPGELGVALAQLDAGSASPIPWLRGLQRRLVTLGDMRAAIDRGEPAAAVMKRNRVHFSQTGRTEHDLRRWSPARIAAALARVRASEVAAVATHNPGAVLAEHMAVDMARRMAGRQP